ncbi:hypothetical protein [Brevundimonas aurantiaca]|uniref:hypothetical protein n=1 Tax=Brevundimonas aurantiaca TaxID=74316 RepID=UPI001CD79EDA|nr:hypothetical protein [Brevundimonas aurantiaca]
MRVLASLFRPVEAETPYGGRSVGFEPVGSAWLTCGTRRRIERGEGDQRRTVERLSAEARGRRAAGGRAGAAVRRGRLGRRGP